MAPIRKPNPGFKKMASSAAANGTRTMTPAVAPPRPAYTPDGRFAPPPPPPAQAIEPEPDSSKEIANMARIRAGARSGDNGFTCVRCLNWFPGGTQHACRPYAETIIQPGMAKPGPMTEEEIQLLQQDGQL